MISDILQDQLNMVQDQLFQCGSLDVAAVALLTVLAMRGAHKIVWIFFRAVATAKVHPLFALVAVENTGKETCPASPGAPFPLLTQHLYLVKNLLSNNRRMRIIENKLVFFWIKSLCLIPNGICVSFEIDGTADILFAL